MRPEAGPPLLLEAAEPPGGAIITWPKRSTD
jgi:hypothetical protein